MGLGPPPTGLLIQGECGGMYQAVAKVQFQEGVT
jgi:hypothetical protein